ncbi:hypothetical protein [Bradyrhizobium sp. MOS002]|uniref:hypothetical protein n=1 Tax=Bradyrhizobium sp. MOS002 TaxID=2133947 RepID=UPI000D11E4CF|nr:hypothetical protein [Bradyrhizobium sp. MOS002]PSO30528.1 hypothetical protein C7G41_21265 [Bradyrhizobium sp. MOS002]
MPRASTARKQALHAISDVYPWEAAAVAAKLQGLLNAMDVPLIDAGARKTLQKILYRWDHYEGGTGSERVTLLIRTILESDGNENALVEPIVSAVHGAMRPEWTDRGLAWIEAFDALPLVQTLETMRALELFSEQSLARYLGMALTNKLARMFAPPPVPPKARKAQPPKGKRVLAKMAERRAASG